MNPYWVTLGVAIATSMVGQTLLKYGAGRETLWEQLFDWHTIIGLALYGGAAFLYIIALRRIPLSVALPATAISYVAATLIGHYVFAEPLGPMHIGALVFITVGVVMLALA